MDFASILTEARYIALQTGALLRARYQEPITQTTKSTDIDIVTDADEAAEAFIARELLRRYPEHHLVGEEGGGQGADPSTAAYFWFVDPIDGTTNFASKIPHFAVSLALTTPQREPLVGVIYDPMRDELFSAYKGGGASLNDMPISVTDTDTLVQSVLASGFPYTKHTDTDNNTTQWSAFVTQVRGIRRLGSAALDLAYVAAGRFDGYWEQGLNPWDALAGILLVTEAGGTVTDYKGGDSPQFDERGRHVASNGHIHRAMLDVLAETYS